MRGFISPHVFTMSKSDIQKDGLPSALVKRIQSKRCLWLIRMDPAAIAKLHEASLIGQYSTQAQNLDIIEVAAILACVPDKFSNDASGRKRMWRDQLQGTLKEFVTLDRKKMLAGEKKRCSVYTNVTRFYQHNAELYDPAVIKSNDVFAPRRSFLNIVSSIKAKDHSEVINALHISEEHRF